MHGDWELPLFKIAPLTQIQNLIELAVAWVNTPLTLASHVAMTNWRNGNPDIFVIKHLKLSSPMAKSTSTEIRWVDWVSGSHCFWANDRHLLPISRLSSLWPHRKMHNWESKDTLKINVLVNDWQAKKTMTSYYVTPGQFLYGFCILG